MNSESNQTSTSESDPRFPSGPWAGIYRQWGMQSRQRLDLYFATGAITGGGRDPAGPFIVRGSYDLETGRVTLAKSYDSHRVEYAGASDGDGIEGRWTIQYMMSLTDRGEFHIWPDAEAVGAQQALRAEEPVGA